RVVDVGWGGGNLGEELRLRQGCHVYGIECHADAAAEASKRLYKVWHATVEETLPQIDADFFDCVVLGDILEHLTDPWSVLKQLRCKLITGGSVVASIPNVGHWTIVTGLLRGEWNYEGFGILDRTHLRFFTLQSIKELFWNTGFRIVDLQTNRKEGNPFEPLTKELAEAGIIREPELDRTNVYQYLVLAQKVEVTHSPKVSIVLVNSNGKRETLECLSSIQDLVYSNFDVVVVDN